MSNVQIEISQNAYDYMQTIAEPLVDTTVSIIDRLVEHHKQKVVPLTPKLSGVEMHFGVADLPSVSFTTISTAKINGRPVVKKDWNHVLADVIAACVEGGNQPDEVKSILQANTIEGQPTHEEKTKGYRPIPDVNFAFQGLDAKRACRNIFSLAEQFSISVELSIKWQNVEKAEYPNKTANLTYP